MKPLDSTALVLSFPLVLGGCLKGVFQFASSKLCQYFGAGSLNQFFESLIVSLIEEPCLTDEALGLHR